MDIEQFPEVGFIRPGDEFTTVPAGFVSRHTFSVAGEYEFVCVPHRSAGMVGSFTVEG